jgi:hypothetical protein
MPYKFEFYINNSLFFSANLQCQQCIGTTQKGTECKRKVCIGTPYCFQHLAKAKYLKIATSTVPNSGRGLFAYNPTQRSNATIFQPEAVICQYDGEIIDLRTLQKRYDNYTAPYTVQTTKNQYIDDALQRSIGSIANHKPISKGANAVFMTKRRRGKPTTVQLVAIRPIKNNNEIFVDYSQDYIFDEPTQHRTVYVNK